MSGVVGRQSYLSRFRRACGAGTAVGVNRRATPPKLGSRRTVIVSDRSPEVHTGWPMA
jgi:hypothetical protein